MLKVCLIINTPLPVPAVRGGAIETLATNLVQENEIEQRLDLTIISPFDRRAQQVSRQYRHTQFVYLTKLRCAPYQYMIHYPLAVMKRLFNAPHSASGFEMNAVHKAVKDRADIIVVEGGNSEGFPTLRKIGIPCAYHLHYNPDKPFTNYGYSDVLSVSDFVGRSWQRFNTGLPTRVQTVRNGISHYFSARISPERRHEIRTRLGLAENDFVVLYCGRIIPQKGVEQLLQAFAQISDPRIRLVLIGSTEFENAGETEYSRRIRNEINNLGPRVIALGYQEHSAVSAYQKACDLQVVPSVWEDAAPLVSVEAMASGLPLVVTRSGGLPEYVSPDAAVIVDKDHDLVDHLAQAIVQLKDAPEERRKMSRAGIEAAKNYTARSYYENYVRAVQNIIQRERQ